jgi:hypothetical protein
MGGRLSRYVHRWKIADGQRKKNSSRDQGPASSVPVSGGKGGRGSRVAGHSLTRDVQQVVSATVQFFTFWQFLLLISAVHV